MVKFQDFDIYGCSFPSRNSWRALSFGDADDDATFCIDLSRLYIGAQLWLFVN